METKQIPGLHHRLLTLLNERVGEAMQELAIREKELQMAVNTIAVELGATPPSAWHVSSDMRRLERPDPPAVPPESTPPPAEEPKV